MNIIVSPTVVELGRLAIHYRVELEGPSFGKQDAKLGDEATAN